MVSSFLVMISSHPAAISNLARDDLHTALGHPAPSGHESKKPMNNIDSDAIHGLVWRGRQDHVADCVYLTVTR